MAAGPVYIASAPTAQRTPLPATKMFTEPFHSNVYLFWLHNSGFQQTYRNNYINILSSDLKRGMKYLRVSRNDKFSLILNDIKSLVNDFTGNFPIACVLQILLLREGKRVVPVYISFQHFRFLSLNMEKYVLIIEHDLYLRTRDELFLLYL
jgi:hypothetical protein